MLTYDSLKKIKVGDLEKSFDANLKRLYIELDKIKLQYKNDDEVTRVHYLRKLYTAWFANNGKI